MTKMLTMIKGIRNNVRVALIKLISLDLMPSSPEDIADEDRPLKSPYPYCCCGIPFMLDVDFADHPILAKNLSSLKTAIPLIKNKTATPNNRQKHRRYNLLVFCNHIIIIRDIFKGLCRQPLCIQNCTSNNYLP